MPEVPSTLSSVILSQLGLNFFSPHSSFFSEYFFFLGTGASSFASGLVHPETILKAYSVVGFFSKDPFLIPNFFIVIFLLSPFSFLLSFPLLPSPFLFLLPPSSFLLSYCLFLFFFVRFGDLCFVVYTI